MSVKTILTSKWRKGRMRTCNFDNFVNKYNSAYIC